MNQHNAAGATDRSIGTLARREAARDSNYGLLRPILNTYLVIYLGVAIGHAAVLPAGAREWMLGTVGLALLLGAGLRLALHFGYLRPSHTEAVIWALLAAMTVNPFAHLAVTGDIHQTTGLLFILALSGYFVMSGRQLVVYQAVVVMAWLALLPSLESADRFAIHYGFFLAMAVGVAAVLRVARFDLLDKSARLSASRAMNQELLETLPVGVLASGADGRMVFANEEAARLLEMPVERLMEMGLDHPGWQLVDEAGEPLAVERIPVMLAAARTGRLPQLIVGRRQSDERLVWLALRSFSTHAAFAEGMRTVVTFADITERVEAARAVAESERLLHAIVERVDVAIIGTDGAGRVTRFNPAAERLTGYPAWRAMGWSAETLLDFRRQNIEPLIDGYVTSRAGDAIPVQLDKQPLADGQGAVWVVRDMRPDLDRQRDARVLDKMAALEVLAGGIAHDFNNLMLVVFGHIDAARGVREELAREHLDAAMEALDRARGLTRQLLAFSSESEAAFEPVDVVAALRDVARLTCSGREINVAWRVAEVPAVPGDGAQLRQLFANVMLNAVQIMRGRGRMRIEVSADQNAVRIRVTGEGSDGDGITGAAVAPLRQGAGLGLALAKAVAERHHGRCEVTSGAGSAAVFEVLLPLGGSVAGPLGEPTDERASESNGPAQSGAGEDPRDAGGALALVMDDDELVREALGGMLEHLGFAVEAVADGEAAIARYREAWRASAPPQVAILDLTVKGGLDGASAARRIVELDPDARLVVASGYTDGAEMAEYRAHGFRAALRKPFGIAELDRVLREVSATESAVSRLAPVSPQ